MFEESKKINVTTLLDAMESSDPQAVESLRAKINSDSKLKRELTVEVGRYFLSCIAMSEAYDLKVDEFMHESSPEELANLFGPGECSDAECCDDEECEDEDGCCGSC